MKQFTEEFAKKFKRGYSRKMGGIQTIALPNGQNFYFDDREYYSGRGAKYNSSIKHDNLGIIEVSKNEVSLQLKHERERKTEIKEREIKRIEDERRYNENKNNGVYGLKEYDYGTFVELSNEESQAKTFDPERLAKTLNITTEDAKLLFSMGKTYVFAKQLSTGKIIELYHSSLDCNRLTISVSYPTPERVAEFNHDEWASAPYAGLVGMTDNKNHFVC